ncbi:sensor histidine kinase [Microbacterium karelineae]|uniref:sensor histidine kinase n=1 Tax=Microbacterium karelineae TaxID=2654283 RepID=UPI0012EA58C5|nr:histidine kinase [Microbacterium karelineae]
MAADARVEFATGARLSVWSRVWRYLLVAVFAVISYLLMYGGFAAAVEDGKPDSLPFAILALFDPIVGLIAIGLLPLRRRAPATIAIITALLSAVSTTTAGGPAVLAAASNATHRRAVPIVANGVAYVAALWVFEQLVPVETMEPLPWWIMLLASGVGFLIPVAFGLYIGARRELIASLHERAIEAERERELQVAAAEAGERTRIAREMHDVLAHRISLVALHAGALTYRDDLAPDEVTRTAVLVQDNARRALTELRQVLGVLRRRESGVEPPQPTLDALPALLDDARQAGALIDDEISTGPGEPPALVSRTAFRVVQEALTNARRHAPGAAIRVRITGHPDGLLAIEVVNGRPSPTARIEATGSGSGLMGLAERVDLADGSLDYGPNEYGGFAVRAWLPWGEEEDPHE